MAAYISSWSRLDTFGVLRALNLKGVVSSVVYEPNAVCWPEEVSLFLVTSSSSTGHSSCASAVIF